jgi:hypothetical protein
MRYLLNGFLLVMPLLAFNVMFAGRLPEAYKVLDGIRCRLWSPRRRPPCVG